MGYVPCNGCLQGHSSMDGTGPGHVGVYPEDIRTEQDVAVVAVDA